MLQTIARPKLRDVVAERLKQFIASRDLKPGDRLPTEGELATQFGVSRLSLREATKSLEFLGIVEARPGRGLTVGSVDLDRVTECLGFHPALQDADAVVLIDSRVVIETGILEHVSRRMRTDRAVYEACAGINHRLAQARTLEQWVELDIAFHHSLFEASELSPLMTFADVLAVFFRRFRESVRRAERSAGIASHERILSHLLDGRVAEARTEMRTHIESHKQRLELPT